MAQFFKPGKTLHSPSRHPVEVVIERLDHQTKGVARYRGRPLFVAGTLPGERVRCRIIEQKRNWAEGELLEVLEPAAERIKPACPHYQLCGGCQLQHLEHSRQLEIKQRNLAQLLEKFAGCQPQQWAPALADSPWHYRRVCRLGVQYDPALQRLTLGFRQRRTNRLVAIGSCSILAQPLQSLLAPLSELLAGLRPKPLGHVELYGGEFGVALLLRYLVPLTAMEQAALRRFAEVYDCRIFVQLGGDAVLDWDGKGPLHYRVLGERVDFLPGDFIQVNEQINELMVAQALEWLQLDDSDRVLDLFCGLGNFSLPIARRVASVAAMEGVEAMVARGRANAARNGLDSIAFSCLDLSDSRQWPEHAFSGGSHGFNKVLLDPARAGAAAMMEPLARLNPERIVYVSCNPGTLVRDAAILIEQGFKISRLGVIDMFPQTAHMESMALFERRQTT